MRPSWVRVWCALAVVICMGAAAFAQSSSSTLSGTVVDSAGGVVPGATVTVKNNATAIQTEAVTNTAGAFSVPALDPGTYTVTISLAGFKTAVVSDVRLQASRPAEIKATLEIGGVNETVEVSSRSELVRTQETAVQSTISSEQINNLPLVSRNTLYFTTFLPGVETQLGPRQSTIMGLPQNTINITIDGISNSNNFQSGDGFFSMVTPRTDAVEEITVTGATPGANSAGAGAVNIAFVTRSGTNSYDGSVYEYLRHPSLNSNYYFNKVNGLERNQVKVHQYGGRIGGPIQIPGLVDGRNKAFFFFNMEHLHQPSEATRTRTVLNANAQNGIYTYTAGGQTRSINMLALAAAANQPGMTSTRDPNVVALFSQINAAMGTTGALNTPQNALNTQQYVYQSPSKIDQYAPTTRVDFNLTDKHRLTGTYYWQRFLSKPDLLNNTDSQFPGMPNFAYQTSYRTTGSAGLRSTLGGNLVNEVKAGWQWSPNNFFGNITPDMFENQGGFSLGFGGGPNNTDFSNLSGVTATRNYAPRNTPNWTVDNTLSWLKGNHSVSVGASFGQIIHDQNTADVAPAITFGVDTNNDPARNLFNTTNFPSASANQLSMARHLYALVTGRITAINGTSRLDAGTGEYVYLGALNQKSKMSDFGAFFQDSWRMKPTLTINYGVRWELQFPFTPITTNWSTATMADVCGVSGEGNGIGGRQCNLFAPNSFGAPTQVPQYVQYDPGAPGFDTDYNNFAPNLGVAWRPNRQDGFLRSLLGDPDQATVRGGYSISFNRERMDRFTGLYGGNVGATTTATNRNNANGNLIYAGESWPLLYREKNRLGPPPFNTNPNYPITASISAGNDINIFDPRIETPYTESWMVGLQRAIGRDTAIEVRYVGNRNRKAWATENWNATNIFENGFLDEFKRAQANLAANVRSGDPTRAGSFAYFGPGTGTQPLPVYLAYLLGLPAAQAGNAASYTGTQWTNSTWVDQLGEYEPSPRGQANSLWTGNSGNWRANAARAGVPANYFVLNPAVDQSNVTRSVGGSKYHSLQIDLRRRLSRGLTVQGNYTFAQRWGLTLEDLHRERIYIETDNVPHAFKMNWVYEVPVGNGRRFGANMNPLLNAVIGNWEFSGTGRVQVRDFGVTSTRIVGMSEKELSDAFEIRVVRNPATGAVTVFNLPDDIIENTRRAYNSDPTSPTGYPAGEEPTGRYLAPPSTPGCISLFISDCGTAEQLWVRGPWFTRFDLSFKKRFGLGGKRNFDLQFDLLNAFDNINFTPVFAPGGGNTIFQVTDGYRDINTTFDPGGRLGQLVFRLSF
jgi:hypothetical protein